MKTVICKRYAGKPLNTAHGIIQFDSNGLVELEDEAADKLATIPGFSIYATENSDGDSGDKNHSTDPEHAENGKEGTQEGENGDSGEGEQPGEGEGGSDEQSDKKNDTDGSDDEQTGKDEADNGGSESGATDELDIEALKKLNVMSLKSLAKKRGLNIDGLSKKDEFISLLTKDNATK